MPISSYPIKEKMNAKKTQHTIPSKLVKNIVINHKKEKPRKFFSVKRNVNIQNSLIE